MKKIKRSELKRLCFCNSAKLRTMKVVIEGVPYEWHGIGWVESDEPVTDDMYEIKED